VKHAHESARNQGTATYPVAGYTGTLVGFAVYGANGQLFWLNFAIAMNIVGVGGALLAALPGFADALLGIPNHTAAKTVALGHGSLNVVSLVLFAITLGRYASHWNGPPVSAVLGIVLGSIGLATTVGAGFLGWMLVQDYHMGIQLTEDQRTAEAEVLNHQVIHMPHRHAA
jgi:uncharacterized membrane protein